MNILFISRQDPRLTSDGTKQRTKFLWNALKSLGSVYTIIYVNHNEAKLEFVKDDPTICYVYENAGKNIKTIKGISYYILDRLCGFVYLPYKYPSDHYFLDIFKGIKFDILVSRYCDSPAKYHYWEHLPTYVDIDDSPLQLYETLIKYRIPKLLRPICRYILSVGFNAFIKKINGGWVSNRNQFHNEFDKISWLPNIPIMPGEDYNASQVSRSYLLTVGAMTYEPNYKGVDTFIHEIWPSFHKKFSNVKYVIGGKGAPKDIAERWKSVEGVSYVGFIDDLNKAYENCIASVVPVNKGSGTCIKTLESLAYSRACISTVFGARGLENSSVYNNAVMIFSDSEEFIKAYERLIDLKERNDFEISSKKFIISNYSKERFAESVTNKIQKQQKPLS